MTSEAKARPMVSVVVPAFNDAAFIAESLNSVLAQDYPSVEIIVVDDGSTDSTRDIVRSFGDRVTLLTQRNQGAAAARNNGIGHASGHYIAFLDADDFWWQGKLSAQVDALQASGQKMAYGRFIIWECDEQGHYPPAAAQFDIHPHPRLSTAAVVSGWNYADLLLDCIVWTSTVIVEREALLATGLFDLRLRKGQDYDLWLRLSRQLPMLGMEQPTALYRTNRASISFRVSEECYEYRIVSGAIERWGTAGPDGRSPPAAALRKRLRQMLFNHGLVHFRRGNPRIAAQSFALLLRRHGLHARSAVYLLLSLFKQLGAPRAR